MGSWLAADCTADDDDCSDCVVAVFDEGAPDDGKRGPADVFTIAGSGMSEGGSVLAVFA